MEKITVGETKIEISNINQQYENWSFVTADIMINGKSFEFYEYVNDGAVDRSADDYYSNNDHEFREFMETLANESRVLAKIRDAVDARLASPVSESEISERLEKTGFRLIGRDPYKNNKWHVSKWLDDNKQSAISTHFEKFTKRLKTGKFNPQPPTPGKGD